MFLTDLPNELWLHVVVQGALCDRDVCSLRASCRRAYALLDGSLSVGALLRFRMAVWSTRHLAGQLGSQHKSLGVRCEGLNRGRAHIGDVLRLLPDSMHVDKLDVLLPGPEVCVRKSLDMLFRRYSATLVELTLIRINHDELLGLVEKLPKLRTLRVTPNRCKSAVRPRAVFRPKMPLLHCLCVLDWDTCCDFDATGLTGLTELRVCGDGARFLYHLHAPVLSVTKLMWRSAEDEAQVLQKLPELFPALTTLSVTCHGLELYGCSLYGMDALRTLQLDECDLTPGILESLELHRLPLLTRLSLDFNDRLVDDMPRLLRLFDTLPRLTHLSIDYCDIMGMNIVEIMRRLPALEELSVCDECGGFNPMIQAAARPSLRILPA